MTADASTQLTHCFPGFPDTARAWIIPLERALSGAEATEIQQAMSDFIETWNSHGEPLTAAASVLFDQFLVIVADEEKVHASGCAVDKLEHAAERALEGAGVPRLPYAFCMWLDDNRVRVADADGFRALVKDSVVSSESLVFDNSVTRLEQVRGGEWLKPFNKSWHARRFT